MIELMTNLPKIKIEESIKSLLMRYISEVVSTGPIDVVYPNFSYLQHHARNFINQPSYSKLLNKFILFSKRIKSGKEVHLRNKSKFLKENIINFE